MWTHNRKHGKRPPSEDLPPEDKKPIDERDRDRK